MHRLLIALSFAAGCTATVRTVPPPAEPAPPPPAPAPAPVVVAEPAAAPMPPPPPEKHPAYMHALSDLRAARAFLERPAGMPAVRWDEAKARQQIDKTIQSLREAAIDDGKNVDDHPPVDRPTWGGRLQRALELLESAQADVNQAEENPATRGLKQRALNNIASAQTLVREGIENSKTWKEPAAPPPPPPPVAAPAVHSAYGAALGSLRHARALLERPAGAADVKWDEKMAIGEIDAAINEARNARMDDGVPLTEHPAIDNKMVYRDRLREAMKMLGDSARDLEEREDNGWAKRDRRSAVEHVRRAEKAVREAISDRKADAEERKAGRGH